MSRWTTALAGLSIIAATAGITACGDNPYGSALGSEEGAHNTEIAQARYELTLVDKVDGLGHERVFGMEATDDGELLIGIAPDADGSQPVVRVVDPATGETMQEMEIALPDGYLDNAGGYAQILRGWGLTQLLGGSAGDDDQHRSGDVWALSGAVLANGFNTERVDEGVNTAPIAGQEPSVGICALQGPDGQAPDAADNPLSASATGAVITSAGSPALSLRDPSNLMQSSAVTVSAIIDDEVVSQRQPEGEVTSAETGQDVSAGVNDMRFDLGATMGLVPGLAELDCLDTDQVARWSGAGVEVGDNPMVLAVVDQELAGNFFNGLVDAGHFDDPALRVADLGDVDMVGVDPLTGVATTGYTLVDGDVARPAGALSAVAVDVTDPTTVWVSFSGDGAVYEATLR